APSSSGGAYARHHAHACNPSREEPRMWHNMVDLDPTVLEKVLRSIAIYLFLALALRFFGKRELGQSNTLDLVVLLLVANAVQNGIIGADNSVTGALIGAIVL